MSDISPAIDRGSTDIFSQLQDMYANILAMVDDGCTDKASTSTQVMAEIQNKHAKIHGFISNKVRKIKQVLQCVSNSVQRIVARSKCTQKTNHVRSASSRQARTKSSSSTSSDGSSDSDGPARPSLQRNRLNTFLQHAVNFPLQSLSSVIDFTELALLNSIDKLRIKFQFPSRENLPSSASKHIALITHTAGNCKFSTPIFYFGGAL